MQFWSKGLGKKQIGLTLSKGEQIAGRDFLYVKGQMEKPVDWEYIMPMKGEDIADFMGLLKEPAMADYVFHSPDRWKVIGSMVVGGLELAVQVAKTVWQNAQGESAPLEDVVLEVPPPSYRKKKGAKRKVRGRLGGAKTVAAPSAGPALDDEEAAKAASAGG
jgi:hypothetical protein